MRRLKNMGTRTHPSRCDFFNTYLNRFPHPKRVGLSRNYTGARGAGPHYYLLGLQRPGIHLDNRIQFYILTIEERYTGGFFVISPIYPLCVPALSCVSPDKKMSKPGDEYSRALDIEGSAAFNAT